MRLTQATIRRIVETAAPHIERNLSDVSFTLICTVEEGRVCRLATADWSDGALAPLAVEIVDEIGSKMVEHSARRQVVVSCRIPAGKPAEAHCECDRGDGFAPIEVTES